MAGARNKENKQWITGGFVALLCYLAVIFGSTTAAAMTVRSGMEQLIRDKIQTNIDTYLASGDDLQRQHQFLITLTELYRSRNYDLIWSDSDQRLNLMETLYRALEDGLDPKHYAVTQLTKLFSLPNTSNIQQINTDLRATESLIRLLSHLYYGKVDPRTFHPSFKPNRRKQLVELIPEINSAIDNQQLPELMSRLTPNHPSYEGLKQNLAWLRSLEKSAKWPTITIDKRIRPGESHTALVKIRQRILPDSKSRVSDAKNYFYDQKLTRKVMQFQRQHQLLADGIIGPKTVAALNVPLTEKIDKVRANLERMRWTFRDLDNDYLLVDIAGFEAHLYLDSKRVWSSRTQVGMPVRETPVFKSKIVYLEWNPDWTVPPTIFKEDLLPKIVGNPEFFNQHDFQLLDHQNRPLQFSEVSWNNINERNHRRLPFKIRQRPGPQNALGRVKFIFPNPYYIYLHDTPSKTLFNSEERAFSSGCVRIENPYELAELLLEQRQKPHQSRQQINEILLKNTSERQYLPAPLPILLVYRTAQITDSGMLKFSPDIYRRDPSLVLALDQKTTSI